MDSLRHALIVDEVLHAQSRNELAHVGFGLSDGVLRVGADPEPVEVHRPEGVEEGRGGHGNAGLVEAQLKLPLEQQSEHAQRDMRSDLGVCSVTYRP